MGVTILFIVFLFVGGAGLFLIWKRTGNYDGDFFTKIIGWIIFLPAIWIVLESLKIIN